MDKKKLKEKLHQYIDNLEDEAALQRLHKEAVAYEMAGKRDVVEELTPKQEARLKEPIKQVDDDKTISHDETMKRIAEWAFKLD